jgi:glycosyltransferase involved in cell wall biosynthesis
VTRRDVVWVSPELPAEPRSGASLRSHRLLQSLTPYARVTVVLVGDAEPARLRDAVGAAAVEVYVRPATRAQKAAIAVRRGWPRDTAAAWSRVAHARVNELAAGGALVIVDHLQMAPYLPVGGHVLNLHNAEASLLADAPRAGLWAAQSWDVRTTRELERKALRRAGQVVVVSDLDAHTLGVSATVVPNGADLPGQPTTRDADGTVLFVGALKYAPNREAVAWWADSIWQAGMPPLTVLGSGNEHLSTELQHHPSVRFVGEVAAIGPWLSGAAVVAVPLVHGGGTRLKVLEALAWGRPVVSTSKGVEGLPVVDGQHVLLADDPPAFRSALTRLAADPAFADELGQRGRVLAEGFAWPALTPSFVAAVLDP